MNKANKKNWTRLISLFIVMGVLVIGFISYDVFKFQPQTQTDYPSISRGASAISAGNELFYYSGDIYGYDLATNATQTLISLDPNNDTNFLQRVATSTLAFVIWNQTSSTMYMFNAISGKLTKEVDTASFIDNFDAISPDEFAYSEALSTSTNGYDNIFLFKNGTTTKIGQLLPPVEYGSQISHSPDGKYLFFADEIYDIATGKWQSISSNQNCTIGNESAWLSDNVIALLRQDDDGGLLCTYDTTSHAVRNLGYVQSFDVSGNDIFYDVYGTTTPELFQIFDYNYADNTTRLILPDAQLMSVIPTLQAVVYQPVTPEPSCYTIDCTGGVASGSLMRFDIDTQKSYPLMIGIADFGKVF